MCVPVQIINCWASWKGSSPKSHCLGSQPQQPAASSRTVRRSCVSTSQSHSPHPSTVPISTMRWEPWQLHTLSDTTSSHLLHVQTHLTSLSSHLLSHTCLTFSQSSALPCSQKNMFCCMVRLLLKNTVCYNYFLSGHYPFETKQI